MTSERSERSAASSRAVRPLRRCDSPVPVGWCCAGSRLGRCAPWPGPGTCGWACAAAAGASGDATSASPATPWSRTAGAASRESASRESASRESASRESASRRSASGDRVSGESPSAGLSTCGPGGPAARRTARRRRRGPDVVSSCMPAIGSACPIGRGLTTYGSPTYDAATAGNRRTDVRSLPGTTGPAASPGPIRARPPRRALRSPVPPRPAGPAMYLRAGRHRDP